MCRPVGSDGMQVVKIKRGVRTVHVETELGIVNIQLGFRDDHGRKFEAIMVHPDQYIGEPKVVTRGGKTIRMVRLKRLA